MAEFLWTFAVQEVLKKLVKLAAKQIALTRGLEKELSKLRKWLLKAETFLSEIYTKKLHHDSARLWVKDLQQLVHEADDLLDELVYEHLRRKVETRKMKRVRNLVSLSNNAFIFRLKMAKKIKNIADLLYQHCDEQSPLGLVGDQSTQTEIDLSQLRETVSDQLDDYEIIGRDIEVSTIVKQVIDASNQQVTSILPIVGMGGLGKTTLAKLVINHETIKEHFDKTVWVCVSEPFIINKILGAILQDLKGPSYGACDIKGVLLRELQKEMRGRRYFLVLDDVWNENSLLWGELKSCLMSITEKSENSILVTTRSTDVAKIMETVSSHHVSKLSDDQCWSLFTGSANAKELSMTPTLEVVREELVNKIGGIPLVARVLGRSVQFQGDHDRWVTILQSVARTPFQEGNFALSILKLSVNRLPSSSLKQCFAYCSNFPKDFVFKKEHLIQMWMAQGFIQPQEEKDNKTIEDIGDEHFQVLLSRFLFQDVKKDARGRIYSCKMHDLIHDIACDVSSNDHKLQLDPSKEELWMDENEKIASKLRTLVCDIMMPHKIKNVIYDKIVNFVCLRVLILNSRKIVELPNSIGKLKHLRYLDISSSSIKKLPKSIVLLYNLQTLRMSYSTCLPKNLRQLVNLRHLEFPRACLENNKHMPPDLSQLIELQTLPYFKVGFEKGCKLTELGALKNLKGSLELLQLEQVKSKEEAKDAKLVEKENLSELVFKWRGSHNNDLKVLEGLQPHKNLQSLEIKYFGGKCWANNIFVENLVAIKLYWCRNCEMLPMLGQLANLEELDIWGFNNVRRIGNEFYGNDSNQRTFFPKLKKLHLQWMQSLEQWEEVTVAPNVTTFPLLKELKISWCFNLLSIPDVFCSCDKNGHLEILKISECSKLTKLPNGLQCCRSIQKLKILGCYNLNMNLKNNTILSSLSIGPVYKLSELAHLTHLNNMKIHGNMPDLDFSILMHLPSLTKLKLYDASNIATSLPQQLEHLITLQDLKIYNFGGIEVLPECLGNLTSLQNLYLIDCRSLRQLPSKEVMLRLTKLCYLKVEHCPRLLLNEGDLEWAKVSHVPRIYVH